MPTILLDENIDGYAEHLGRVLFSPAWNDISCALGVRIVVFDEAGLTKGAPDDQVWDLCQRQQFYLLTDNRNQDKPDSLESTIRTRTLPNSLPVFTISDVRRFRTDRDYVESVVAKLLEYLMDSDSARRRQALPSMIALFARVRT